MTQLFIGVDIQTSRDCCFTLVDEGGVIIESGWLGEDESEFTHLIRKLCENHKVTVGIDAPRKALSSPRQWYWDRSHRRWRPRDRSEKGYGRHCEVVISAHKLANPQWTPLAPNVPEWMAKGFKLFTLLESFLPVYEVFPTASYALLENVRDVQLTVDFSSCRPGPKDIIDAWVAAATVREFVKGNGSEIGGGDGLGTIILPRPLPEPIIHEVLYWPRRI